MYNPHTIYHVYNQSINYEKLFRNDSQYNYFLEKCRKYLRPHARIFSYCLMPDHFHFLLMPTELGCAPSRSGKFLKATEDARSIQFQQNLSQALKTLLSSYTQAINKQHGRRGSLFKAKTKAKPGYHEFYPDSLELDDRPFTQFIPYLQICFHYIHDNPVKAKLVTDPLEWMHSSAIDYTGLRDSGLCDYRAAERLLNIPRNVLLPISEKLSYFR